MDYLSNLSSILENTPSLGKFATIILCAAAPSNLQEGKKGAAIIGAATLTEHHSIKVKHTRYPVSKNFVVSDHSIVEPRKYEIKLLVSDVTTSYSLESIKAIPLLLASTDKGKAAVSADYFVKNNTNSTYNLLRHIAENGLKCTIASNYEIYTDMYIESVSVPIDVDSVYSFAVTMQFVQLKHVETIVSNENFNSSARILAPKDERKVTSRGKRKGNTFKGKGISSKAYPDIPDMSADFKQLMYALDNDRTLFQMLVEGQW